MQTFAVDFRGQTRNIMASDKGAAVDTLHSRLVQTGEITPTHDIRMQVRVRRVVPVIGMTLFA